jgi:hypothetical protein
MGNGIDQRLDDLVELHDGAGPTMGDEQRQGIGMR